MVTKEQLIEYYLSRCTYHKGSPKLRNRKMYFKEPMLPYLQDIEGNVFLPYQLKKCSQEPSKGQYIIQETQVLGNNAFRIPDPLTLLAYTVGNKPAPREAKPKPKKKAPKKSEAKSLHDKQAHSLVTFDLLAVRASRAIKAGFPKAKWIEFCEQLLGMGLTCYLYEALETKSKYITIHKQDFMPFKVRFSDHKPGNGNYDDCNFLVGKTRDGRYQSTTMALQAVINYFGAYRIYNDSFNGGV